MFYINESSPKRIVEIIESVDGTLLFNSKEKLEKVMASINFKLSTEPSVKSQNYDRFLYSGIIHGLTVHLNYFQDIDSQDIKLTGKFYMKLNESFQKGVRHRENDLPAIIAYSVDEGYITCLEYYINDKKKRLLNKPVFISMVGKDGYDVVLRYYDFDDYSAENFSIYSADLMGDKIIDAKFCYDHSEITLTEMIEIIPEIKSLKIQDLENLRNHSLLTAENRTLFHMSKI